MAEWTPMEWAGFFTALGTFITAVLSSLAAFWAKVAKNRSEDNAAKLDHNTALTIEGAKSARQSAVSASTVEKKMNGGLKTIVAEIVSEQTATFAKNLEDHIEQDENNMLEIRNALSDLKSSIEGHKGE